MNDKSPSRKVNELDNRGSHFYLSLYWAEELTNQQDDAELSNRFKPVYEALSENEDAIVKELNDIQGKPVDIEGYYFPNEELASKAMRPSELFNRILTNI
jgi:isocitrate dehydrogenase